MTDLYPWLIPYYQQIIRAFQRGQGHHALLLRAEAGLGAGRLVSRVARRIMCEMPQDEQPCGHCHACHLMHADNHPDFYRLQSIDNKDIGVDQVREINEKVSQHAQQNGNKIVRLDAVERLTEAAANALLKTLEEPQANTYFLLQADLSSPLMATIYSRCQVWVLNVPGDEVGMNWLQAQYQGEISDISTALRINHFRPLSALQCLEQNLLEKRKTLLAQFWKFYTRGDILQLLPYFEKEIIFQQIDWLSDFLMDAVKAKLAVNQYRVCEDFRNAVQQFAAHQTIMTLLNANSIMHKVRSDLATINAVNQDLMLIDCLSRLLPE